MSFKSETTEIVKCVDVPWTRVPPIWVFPRNSAKTFKR